MSYRIQDQQGHSPRVARKRQERMRGLVARALSIVREEGVEALTLSRLAASFEVTAASLYRYFPSKDALVAELQRSVIAWLAEATRKSVGRAREAADSAGLAGDASLLDVVITAFSFEAFARRSPVEFGLVSMHLSTPEFALSDREAARVFETAWQSLSELAEPLARAEAGGALAPGNAEERAVTLWASLQGVVQTRKLVRSAKERVEPTALVRSLVPALLIGWGARPEEVGRLVDFVTTHELAEPTGSVDDLLAADAA